MPPSPKGAPVVAEGVTNEAKTSELTRRRNSRFGPEAGVRGKGNRGVKRRGAIIYGSTSLRI